VTGTIQLPGTPVLSDVHRAYLNEHAVRDEVIASQGIRSDGDSIVFTWREDDRVTEQRRPWPGDAGVYYWEPGQKLHLNILRDPGPGAPVLLTEGTKQSLAVASWAPAEYAVYGMPGCYGWVTKGELDLHRFAGRQVLIMLDADAADNLDVYEAGERLAHELSMEEPPAVASFVPSPAWGKDGIDDYLGRLAAGRRADRLAKLLTVTQARPADRKPTRRPARDPGIPDTGDRPPVIVNRDRLAVIMDILGHMMTRWNGRDLFCFGDVLTRVRTGYTPDGHLSSARTEPVDKDAFLVWLSACVATYKYKKAGLTAPAEYEPAWPDRETISAVLARGDEFAPLRRLSRAPFIRPDGTVCAKQGYDPATATLLITGNSGMDRLDIPDNPGQDAAAAAARFLLDSWLGDFCWRDESSQAGALALALTPIVRGLVPLVPLAVVSGLQPGVGKGLLADCIQLMITGEATPPLPWLPDDDDENRKQITSAFRGGANLMWFDEAHRIDSHALSRAITSLTYSDRILGVSKMAAFPNQVTWLATGNQVAVSADMARRAHWIELHPDMPDPDTRPESDFTHPDLRSWTADNRPELITAALTLVRAWFAAGCPAYSRGALMGSFERWDKTMSGILGYAGVPGFLAGLAERRAERDTSGGYWAEHLAWLARQFGTQLFTALDVKVRAMASGGSWDAPPGLDEPDVRGWTRNLGQAYGRNQNRYFGAGLRIIKAGTGHGTLVKWQVQERGGEPIHPIHPSPGSGLAQTQTVPDLARRDRMDQVKEPADASSDTGVAQPNPGLHDLDTLPDLGRSEANPAPPGQDGLDGLDGSFPLGTDARAGARTYTRTHEGEGGGYPSRPSNPSAPVPGFRLDFDLEGCDADELFTSERGFTLPDGTGFIRLAGVTGPSGRNAIVPVGQLLALLGAAGEIGGHNILGFDGLALAWHHGMDWRAFVAKARDTEIIARQAFPPRSRESGTSADKLGLDAVARLLGVAGKSDDLHRLKRKHGGYDKIPADDLEYRSYLEGDLDATRDVAGQLVRHYHEDPYLPREHQAAGLAGQISLNGFLVDQPLLEQRLAEGAQRKAQALQLLHEGWGLPLTKTVTRGRGDKKTSHEIAMESPLATDAGREWLAGQWARYQVPAPPLTETGKLALSDDALKPVAADPACPPDLRAMIALMGIVTGTRTVYQNAAAHLAPDGRVHPKISMRQASGRWSTTGPGLTVFGKHGGRHVERDIFTADEGHVLFSCDLSQVDMRGIAALSQDPAYIALFADASRDAHAEIAAQVFGDPHGGHCPPGCELRQNAKARGHGWNYGLSAKRMIEEGSDPEMVYRFVNGMAERFPRLISWREEVRATAKAGMILDNGFGRRMRADPARAYTVAPALMGQGSAGDIMKEVLLRLDQRAPELRPYYRVMVHDEQVFSCPEKDAPEIIRIVQEAFTWEFRGVPITCDVNGPGRTWGEISGGK
jgi:DNA polymerase family A/Domain of unknown function (DUF3854)